MKMMMLETKKISMKPYLLTGVSIPFVTLLFLYLLANVPNFDPNVLEHNPEFGLYSFLYKISFIINVAGYTCLCATMLSKIVMEAYSERNLYLTLGYPVARGKILIAKLVLCLGLCSIGVFAGIFVTNILFFFSESIFPFLSDQLTFAEIINQWPWMLTGMVLVISISLIALFIGWRKKSIALTVISAFLLNSIPSNLLTAGNETMIMILSLFLLGVGGIMLYLMRRQVLEMEA